MDLARDRHLTVSLYRVQVASFNLLSLQWRSWTGIAEPERSEIATGNEHYKKDWEVNTSSAINVVPRVALLISHRFPMQTRTRSTCASEAQSRLWARLGRDACFEGMSVCNWSFTR